VIPGSPAAPRRITGAVSTAKAPARPALLVVDPQEERRRGLAQGLSAYGYEVVPTVSVDEGLRFAANLGPAVVVAPAAVTGHGEGSVLMQLAGSQDGAQRTVVLYGEAGDQAEDLPDEVLFVATAGLDSEALVHRVRLVLVGREIGAEPDPAAEQLVGDLSRIAPLELTRSLARLGVSGRLTVADGELLLADGAVLAARVGAARGAKAFCRLGRRHEGWFRVSIEAVEVDPAAPEAIRRELTDLIIEAIEDAFTEAPDPRLLVEVTGAQPASASVLQREIFARAQSASPPLAVGVLADLLTANDGAVFAALEELRAAGVVTLREPQGKVRVVTDSTADLPPELARAHGILVVPLKVIFGKRVLRDGVDVTPKVFYELLEKSAVHPTTSPPERGELFATYNTQVAQRDVVSLHLSSKLSLTFAEATAAATDGRPAFLAARRGGHEPKVEVFDSASVSLGLGLQALFAARLAERGLGPDEIVARLTPVRERMQVLFVVDTLEFLARGGRIGKAQAMIGGLLGIKPILGVVGGEVVAVDKVRGGRRAHPRIIELLAQRLDKKRPVIAAIAHANAPVWSERLKTELEKTFTVRELFLAEMGPVVGAHAGPGTVGAAVYQPADAEEMALLANP
jgi:DegV family protein with EDD domain